MINVAIFACALQQVSIHVWGTAMYGGVAQTDPK